MKRTPLSRGTKQLKRTPLKKKSKVKLSTLKNKLWDLCKQIIRKKYQHECYTCQAKGLVGSNLQTGHMWAKASLGAHLKHDLRILRPQCFACNIHRGGMGADFYVRMVKENGQEYMDSLEKERTITIKADETWYTAKIEEYQSILNSL